MGGGWNKAEEVDSESQNHIIENLGQTVTSVDLRNTAGEGSERNEDYVIVN